MITEQHKQESVLEELGGGYFILHQMSHFCVSWEN